MKPRAPAVLLLCAALLAAAAAARAGEPDAMGPIIELPKFEVVDSRLLPPPESWRYAEIPGFEILSNISERETRRFTRDFLLLQEVIEAIMPALNRGRGAMPTALLLCGRGRGFDEFVPAAREAERYGTNSLFFQSPERAAIVVDFALAELQLDNETRQEADPYRGFYLAYYRFLIRRQLARPPPPWLEEGLVQILAATDFNRKWINFAQIGDGFGGEKTGDFNRLLHQRALMGFPELLADPPGRRDAFWSAQCYAFVHYCLYGMGKRHQQPFLKFVSRLGDEPVSEALFTECFKKTYKAMNLELRGYLDFTAHTSVQFKAKKGQELPEPPAVALREATDAEVGRLKGEVLRLGEHAEAAHTALIAPYIRGERDPRLLAALGLDERAAGHDERARRFLEAAAAAKVVRPRAYLELARLRFTALRAGPAGAAGRFDAAQLAPVFEALFAALRQPPPMAEVYALVAEVWLHSTAALKRENFDVVLQGVRQFPRDSALLLQATRLAAARGFPAEARVLAERGTRLARTPAEQDEFAVIAAALPREAAPPAPPSP